MEAAAQLALQTPLRLLQAEAEPCKALYPHPYMWMQCVSQHPPHSCTQSSAHLSSCDTGKQPGCYTNSSRKPGEVRLYVCPRGSG